MTKPAAGTGIVRADLAGTAIFVIAGMVASIDRSARSPMVITSLVLFAIGVVGFVWSFFVAAERSRRDELGVANLYLLTGQTAPSSVKRTMSAALAVQVAASLFFGTVGFSGLADDEINLMAFGILVPTFGLGLNGMWSARHGRFGPRIVASSAPPRRRMPPSDPELEKNARHD